MQSVARYGPVFGLLVTLIAASGQAWGVTAQVGLPAPELSLPSIYAGGERVNLGDHRGKIVYLDFWSSWCAPCRRAMPQLDALRKAFRRDEFEVIAVNVDPVAADGRRFLEQLTVSYPVAADAAGDASARYGVDAVPALFVIDRAGRVREIVRGDGVEDAGRLRAKLMELIDEDRIR